jgi:hypothetical protein
MNQHTIKDRLSVLLHIGVPTFGYIYIRVRSLIGNIVSTKTYLLHPKGTWVRVVCCHKTQAVLGNLLHAQQATVCYATSSLDALRIDVSMFWLPPPHLRIADRLVSQHLHCQDMAGNPYILCIYKSQITDIGIGLWHIPILW